jgi:predicted restriction endonuclease
MRSTIGMCITVDQCRAVAKRFRALDRSDNPRWLDPKHLRASHIKPWRDASNDERLKGHNGLLLSPHIDHLFDQGYISFSPSEQLLVVPEVRTDLLGKWGIDAGTRVGTFTVEQQAFLEYHRVNVFNRARGG